jgi:hypothetical protein
VFSEPGLDASSSRFYAERKPIEREVVAVLPHDGGTATRLASLARHRTHHTAFRGLGIELEATGNIRHMNELRRLPLRLLPGRSVIVWSSFKV